MRDKKTIKDWKVTALYLLIYTVLTAIIYMVGAGLFVIYSFITLRLDTPYLIGYIYFIALSLLQLWIGTRISASYIKKRFVINNILKITNLATLYYGFINTVLLLRDLLTPEIDGVPLTKHFPYMIITSILSIALFYFFTKKYLSKSKDTMKENN